MPTQAASWLQSSSLWLHHLHVRGLPSGRVGASGVGWESLQGPRLPLAARAQPETRGSSGAARLLVPHLADVNAPEEPRSAELSVLCGSGEWCVPRGSATSVGSEGCLWEEVDWPRKPFMMF